MEIINQTPFLFAPFAGRIGFPGHSLTLIIKGTFDLVPDGMAVISDEQFFTTGDELYPDDDEGNGSSRYESDFAYFKPRADLLLAGTCYSPGGKPVKANQAIFQVGTSSQIIGVFGDRFWHPITKTISDPIPFTSMDLRYERSFGGTGYNKNPVGKGYSKIIDKAGSKVWPLPNIEDLRNLVDSPGKHPDPAGFGPFSSLWQQRSSKLGTYKGSWQKDRWPWFPKDFDWGYYNAAPFDMQVDGYLKGDEQLYFENLHSKYLKYKSCLPGINARVFVYKSDSHKPDVSDFNPQYFTEISLNLDTLWADMDAEKLVLVWRGVTDILSEDSEEIKHIFIASEKINEKSRSKEYYYDLFLKQFIEEKQSFEIEPDIEKAEIDAEIEDEPIDFEKELEMAEEEIKAAMLKAGIDPDENLPEPTPKDREDEARLLKELGLEEEKIPLPLTREKIKERILKGDGFAGEDLRKLDLSELDLKGLDFKDAILSGVNLKKSDLSEADLSGANLSETDLSETCIKDAILKDADLTKADLSGSDLSGSNFEDAICDSALFQNAILENIKAKDAGFFKADLSRASLKNSFCETADFSGSILNETGFQSANLFSSSFEGAAGNKIDMSDANITELRVSGNTDFSEGIFKNVIGPYSIWENAKLDGADFSFSKMEGANFAACSLRFANFAGADLKYARLSKADLRQAKCVSMNLFQASLEKADLTETDLRGSNLFGAELLDAIIDETRLDYANLKMTKLGK